MVFAPNALAMLYSRKQIGAGWQMNEIDIIIVDDHPLFREGVRNVIDAESDLHVVGEAISGDQALDVVREFKPQVALVDINLPAVNGIQVTRQITTERLKTAVVLLGASAYCSKDIEPGKLVDIIRQAAKGHYIVGDLIYDREGLENWLEKGVETVRRPHLQGDVPPYAPLSPREREILQYVSRGMSNKDIAVRLGISHQTVKNHMTSILHKLDVEDRTQAAVYALRHGWVRLQDTRK